MTKAVVDKQYLVDSNHFSVATATNRLHVSKKEFIDGLDDLVHVCKYKDQLQLIFNHTGKFKEHIEIALLKFDSDKSLSHFHQILEDYLLERNFESYKRTLNYASIDSIRIEDCVLYVPNQSPIELGLVSRVSVEAEVISFKMTSSIVRFTESVDNIQKIKSLTDVYFKNTKTLAIFKEVSKNNPILSPKDAWANAEETYSMLKDLDITFAY